jgi:hypothetical protein
MLRRISGSDRDEVTEGRRKLHNDEPHSLHSSPNITKIIKSMMIRLTEQETRIGHARK